MLNFITVSLEKYSWFFFKNFLEELPRESSFSLKVEVGIAASEQTSTLQEQFPSDT